MENSISWMAEDHVTLAGKDRCGMYRLNPVFFLKGNTDFVKLRILLAAPLDCA
jgi:hypothetical protein